MKSNVATADAANLRGFAGLASAATADIEFVAEHLPAVGMDNRYGSLRWSVGPAWSVAGFDISGDLTPSHRHRPAALRR